MFGTRTTLLIKPVEKGDIIRSEQFANGLYDANVGMVRITSTPTIGMGHDLGRAHAKFRVTDAWDIDPAGEVSRVKAVRLRHGKPSEEIIFFSLSMINDPSTYVDPSDVRVFSDDDPWPRFKKALVKYLKLKIGKVD